MLPATTPESKFFWKAAAQDRLEILRCRNCRMWLHPPAPACRSCGSRDLAPERVSGRGVLYSFTVNHQPWNPTMPPPYVIGLVELEEQEGLRLTTNIVELDPEDIEIGMPLEVTFEHLDDDTGFPLFRPRLAGVHEPGEHET